MLAAYGASRSNGRFWQQRLDMTSPDQHRFASLHHAPRPARSITWLGLTPAPEVGEPVGMLGALGKAVPACVCALPRLRFLDISGGDCKGSAGVSREALLIQVLVLGPLALLSPPAAARR